MCMEITNYKLSHIQVIKERLNILYDRFTPKNINALKDALNKDSEYNIQYTTLLNTLIFTKRSIDLYCVIAMCKYFDVNISDVLAEPDSENFEQLLVINKYNTENQSVLNDPNYTGLEKMTVENVEIDNPSLTHNVVNVYTPANDAVITIKDSKFNLTVDTSNALRLSNYLNSDNVTVNFENVEWTYENSVTADDWKWAGLVIYQPASKDVALTGDLTHINTWTFNFKNCKYNGVKVTANNFGEHNQVGYTYNVNKSNAVADLSEAATFNFA